MLTLINTNRMQPPIAPIGLDYVAGAVRGAGFEVELLDLCLVAGRRTRRWPTTSPDAEPELVGLSFRNVDDCFWPSGAVVRAAAAGRRGGRARAGPMRRSCSAASASRSSPQRIVEYAGADFGIRGDGEQAIVALLRGTPRRRSSGTACPGWSGRRRRDCSANPPAWPRAAAPCPPSATSSTTRTYFRRGGQIGVETKRGCRRRCSYCADPLAKGRTHRLRAPARSGRRGRRRCWPRASTCSTCATPSSTSRPTTPGPSATS